MKNTTRFTALIALALIALAAAPATATEGVSPGAVDRVATIEQRCPTFSWGEDDDAAAYELVAYRLPESGQEADELSSENEVLFASVAGAATSWTPSADQCFAPGGRYVWFVRSVTEMVNDQVIEAGEWSAGRYFSVPAGPSAEDVARAVEVLKQWEATNGGGSMPLFADAVSDAGTDAHADAGSAAPKSVPTASAAIRGQHPDTSGEVYGVVGTSASADGAGVAAANTAGGPDLVLDGLTHGETDTALSEAGIDRASVNSEVFVVKNSGPGGMRLSVEGEIAATALDCQNCVDSLTIADGSIIDNDLADDAVTEEKIEHGAVGTAKLQNSSVTSAKIADGAVGTVDLADGSVTAAKIAGGAVNESRIAQQRRDHRQDRRRNHRPGGSRAQFGEQEQYPERRGGEREDPRWNHRQRRSLGQRRDRSQNRRRDDRKRRHRGEPGQLHPHPEHGRQHRRSRHRSGDNYEDRGWDHHRRGCGSHGRDLRVEVVGVCADRGWYGRVGKLHHRLRRMS